MVCNSAPASMIKGSERKPTGQTRCEAVGRWGLGQWAGAVRIKRRQGRFRPDLPGSPITGAGLDPWVCDPSCAPDGITSNGSDGEGCWGRRQPGRTPTLVLTLSGWLLFRKAARALCGLLIHEPPRSSWTTRPQPQVRRSCSWSSWSVMKNNLRRLRRPPATTNSPKANSQGLKNSQRAKGLRA